MHQRFCTATLTLAIGLTAAVHCQAQEQVDAPAVPAAAPQTQPGQLKLDRTMGLTAGAQWPVAAGAADVLSTYVGLRQAGLREGNGLINTSNWGLAGLFVLKMGLVYYADQQPPEARKPILKATSGLWTLGAVNNLLLIVGASNPVSLVSGLAAGLYAYYAEGRILEEEEQAAIAQMPPPRKRATVEVRYHYDRDQAPQADISASEPAASDPVVEPMPRKRAAVEIRRHYDTF